MSRSDQTIICKKVRDLILSLSYNAKSAHVGSSLSCVEILVSCFEIRRRPEFRDSTLILSKGHAAMSLYSTAVAYDLLPASVVETYLKDGTDLWGHPSLSSKYDFIHWSTGSLGHGLPVACGFAYSSKRLQETGRHHFVILSDGELNEGSNWEAILFGAHHQLTNLTVFIDYNKIQSFGRCAEVMNIEPLNEKWQAFGWDTMEVDGHDVQAIEKALLVPRLNKPRVIIAHTIKGRGISEYENTIESHYRPVSADIYSKYVKPV